VGGRRIHCQINGPQRIQKCHYGDIKTLTHSTLKRNLRLDLEYDGANYAGWQVQPDQVTIEAVVVSALSQLFNHPARVTASGRTDAGVHARQQVINVQTSSVIRPEQILLGANSILPDDIAVRRVEEVDDAFDARRSAMARTYRYHLLTDKARSPLLRLASYHYKRTLNEEAMEQACEVFIGRHDFSAFRSTHCDAENPVREVQVSRFFREGPLLVFEITAWAFLRHMVRTIMGTLLQVGEGKLSKKDVVSILESCNRENAGPTAPAGGLVLWEVKYP
jgi:tRNA pseudouridine38-40 synthase